MKAFLFSLMVVCFSSNVSADVPEILAKAVTCSELQEAVENYREVVVLHRPNLFLKRKTVWASPICTGRDVKYRARFKTSDSSSCPAGFFCQEIVGQVGNPYPHPRPDYRPHPRPRPDYRPRPGHAPRGPRYNPGPHRGPRYNPCRARRC